MPPDIRIDLDEVAALAAEVTALATELSGEVALCTSAATALRNALGGDEGWRAGAAGTAWGGLLRLVEERTAAVGATFSAAVESYRAEDAMLGARVGGIGRAALLPR